MTELDFKKETFGTPVKGDKNFKDAKNVYKWTNEYDGIDHKLALLRECFKDIAGMLPYEKGLKFTWDKKFILVKLWEEAKDLAEFKNLIIENELARTTFFADRWLADDEKFLDKFLETSSIYPPIATIADAGGIKLGDENFSFIVGAGGDGNKEVVVFEDYKPSGQGLKKRNIPKAYIFITSIQGKFNLYSYDCGDQIAYTFDGRYGIYVGNDTVIFEKWQDKQKY